MSRRYHIAAAAIVAIAAVSTPVAAHAAGTLYLYAEPGFFAQIGTRNVTGWWNITPGNNDTLSSVRNQTNWSAAFWYDTNRTGSCWSYSPYTDDEAFWLWDDNKASSFALGRAC